MNNPFDYFDNIYCINLDKRPDRWKQCESNLIALDVKAERFSGSVVSEIFGHSAKIRGQTGCALSHFLIYKDAVKRGLKKYLVLEDDVLFRFSKGETFSLLNDSIAELPDNWGMFYLGGNLDCSYGVVPIEEYSDSLFKLNSCHTTHAYAVNLDNCKPFENCPDDALNTILWIIDNVAVDVFLSRFIMPSANCFIPTELLALQRPCFSDIECSNHDYQDWMISNFNQYKGQL